ncbi:PGF-pre-PGF domain-containing protein [Natrarchaeobaculum aegyptiacum]|nr:PGF-pre-PGF domain-containing protein [Natrarchaeobaculum aegyptiacum]
MTVAAAQGDPPGPPASFYGEAVDEDGNAADSGTTIVAVVEGEVEGQIAVETAGEYGGPDAFDEKLSLDSAAGNEVSFRVEDASGPAALEDPVDLAPGLSEQDLTFPAGTFDDSPDNGDDGNGGSGDDGDDTDVGSGTVEFLIETDIDNDHACTHGEYDERTPLEAGNSPDDAPVVVKDHVIWEVTYEGDEGYIRFDNNEHDVYPGLDSWVFYQAGADLSPTDGTVLETGDVDECPSLDGYMEVETPSDGVFDIEVTEDGDVTGPASGREDDQEEEDEEDEEEDETDDEEVTVEDVVETVDEAEPDGKAEIEIDEDADGSDENITVGTGDETESVEEIVLADYVESVSIEEYTENDEVVETTTASIKQYLTENIQKDVEEDGEETDADDNATADVDTPEVTVSTVARITVGDDGGEDTPAAVTMSVAADDINESEQTSIFHQTDGGWEELPTEVKEETDEKVVFSGETSGFSLFAVAEVEGEHEEDTESDPDSEPDSQPDPDPEPDSQLEPETEPEGEGDSDSVEESDDSIPGFGMITAVGVLLGAIVARLGWRPGDLGQQNRN